MCVHIEKKSTIFIYTVLIQQANTSGDTLLVYNARLSNWIHTVVKDSRQKISVSLSKMPHLRVRYVRDPAKGGRHFAPRIREERKRPLFFVGVCKIEATTTRDRVRK